MKTWLKDWMRRLPVLRFYAASALEEEKDREERIKRIEARARLLARRVFILESQVLPPEALGHTDGDQEC